MITKQKYKKFFRRNKRQSPEINLNSKIKLPACQLARKVCVISPYFSPVTGSVMVRMVQRPGSVEMSDTGTRGSWLRVGSSTSGVTMADMSGILRRHMIRRYTYILHMVKLKLKEVL